MIVRITPLTDPARSSSGHRLAWLATEADGRPLGTAFLRVPADGGVADLELRVHPAERRSGVGTQLLNAATEAAAGLNLDGVLTEPVQEGSEGDEFCRARGLRRVLALTYTRLVLNPAITTPDGTAPGIATSGAAAAAPAGAASSDPVLGRSQVGQPVDGYRLVHWEGTVPDELAETFARSRRAMDDMPMDDAGYTPQPWDVARLHAIAEAVAKRGEILCTTAAVTADGEIAGFTELVVASDGKGDGQHYGTGVLPEHRGRGLARWMKAEAIALARVRFPNLEGLLADTADSNTGMRRINDELGYRPVYRSCLYQLDLTRS
ncbi:GNAT family N-acetyltransferase [Actinoplanes aureus]|uniref:GNAT family N-acetyltransferase n=1 Tax=Actinoplanes aureus TaxID=2792083 RepID=A0A931CCY0_9ACTN|nr:GNAT family N-acetyltransferase [Actinoplanes aureus]MBG0562600.1 GNAT family N-acetyltransferase [Actinoplanes aureus]